MKVSGNEIASISRDEVLGESYHRPLCWCCSFETFLKSGKKKCICNNGILLHFLAHTFHVQTQLGWEKDVPLCLNLARGATQATLCSIIFSRARETLCGSVCGRRENFHSDDESPQSFRLVAIFRAKMSLPGNHQSGTLCWATSSAQMCAFVTVGLASYFTSVIPISRFFFLSDKRQHYNRQFIVMEYFTGWFHDGREDEGLEQRGTTNQKER